MNISGFEVPDSIQLNGTTLRLNGAAMRTKFFLNIYIVAFYTAQPITREEEAVHSNIERSLRMIVTTPLATPGIVSENVVSSMKETLGRKFYEMRPVVEKIKSVIDTAQIGYKDCMDTYYSTDGALHVYKNGQYLNSEANAKVFAEALFNIYMGRQPVDAKVKRYLLKGWS
jgi:hypothetical protein